MNDMCCHKDDEATKQIQQETKTIIGYKVLKARRRLSDGKIVWASRAVQTYEWGLGEHKLTDPLGLEEVHSYNMQSPRGFHFYFYEVYAALLVSQYPMFHAVLKVQVSPGDILAVERDAFSSRQGVAHRVVVTDRAWRKFQETSLALIPSGLD